MSWNRKTTTYVMPSVADSFSVAENENEVEDAYTEAVLTYHKATAATKRKWRKAADARKRVLRHRPLVDLTGKSLLHSPESLVIRP